MSKFAIKSPTYRVVSYLVSINISDQLLGTDCNLLVLGKFIDAKDEIVPSGLY